MDVLNQIIYHINNIAASNNYHQFVNEPADLYKLEVSFIHWPEEHTNIPIHHVPFVVSEHLLSLYEFVFCPSILTFQPTSPLCLKLARLILSPLEIPKLFKLSHLPTLLAASISALHLLRGSDCPQNKHGP